MMKTLKFVYWWLRLKLQQVVFIRYYLIYRRYRRFTMIPWNTYIHNLRLATRIKDLPGSIVECGVWRGGMSAGLGDLMPRRRLWLFDSFEGLPDAKKIDGLEAVNFKANPESPAYHDNCKAEQAEAEKAMAKSRAKDVRIVKGWFKDTLTQFPDSEPVALLRLDGDWYESTLECLEHFYPKLVPGGLILIDDYYTWEGCSKAVHDYLSKHKLADRIHQKENHVAYMVKS